MSYDLTSVLNTAIIRKASSIHMKARTPVYLRMLDALEKTSLPVPGVKDIEEIAQQVLPERERMLLDSELQADIVVTLGTPPRRFRVSFFHQRDSIGVVLRHIPDKPPTLPEIGLPLVCREALSKRRGIILVTGPASSGKTTTVAAILNNWIKELDSHIVTLEDPIEYLLTSNRCMVTQRQIGSDTETFASGLRHVLRQDPDIIFVGELDHVDTVSIALAAAETGHLVISTMQTSNAITTIEQTIGMFAPELQEQVRVRLSLALQGVFSQVLIPKADRSSRIGVFELLTPNEAVRSLIRQNQTFRIAEIMESAANCSTFRTSINELVTRGVISAQTARQHLGEKAFAR